MSATNTREWVGGRRSTLGAAGLSGLFLGVGARVVMRFVALEAGLSYGSSIGGSIEVVAFGAMLGAPAAWLFFALRQHLPLARPWAGITYSGLLFGLLAAVPPRAAREALADTPDTPAATAMAFGLLFVGWGLLLEHLSRPVASDGSPAS